MSAASRNRSIFHKSGTGLEEARSHERHKAFFESGARLLFIGWGSSQSSATRLLERLRIRSSHAVGSFPYYAAYNSCCGGYRFLRSHWFSYPERSSITNGVRQGWLIVIAGATMQATNALAQVVGSDASLTTKIANGRSWKMTMEDGRVGALTLFQNGTGKMAGGPMELTPKWRPTPDGLCLKPGALLPERCVQLVRTSSGYIGIRDGKQAFKLER